MFFFSNIIFELFAYWPKDTYSVGKVNLYPSVTLIQLVETLHDIYKVLFEPM